MEEKNDIDMKMVKYFNRKYFDQFSDAMVKLGLLPYPTMTSDLASDIAKVTQEIGRVASKWRPEFDEWSWVPSNDWF